MSKTKLSGYDVQRILEDNTPTQKISGSDVDRILNSSNTPKITGADVGKILGTSSNTTQRTVKPIDSTASQLMSAANKLTMKLTGKPLAETDAKIRSVFPQTEDYARMNVADMSAEEKQALKDKYESLDAGNAAKRLWNMGIRNQVKNMGGTVPENYPDYNKAYIEKQQLSKNYNLIKSEEAHDKLLANGMTEEELREIYHFTLTQDETDALFAQGMTEDEVIEYSNDLADRSMKAQDKLYNLLYELKDNDVSYDDYIHMLQEYYDNPAIAESAKERPVANSIFSVVTNPVESVAAVGKNVIDYATGTPIRRNDTYTDITRQTVNEQIQNPVGRFFYNTGLSAADSAYAQAAGLAIGGGAGKYVGAGLQGFEKGSQVMNEAVDKDLTPNRIMLQGVSSGLTTFLSELVPMGKLSKIADNGLSKYTAKEIAKVIGSQMVTEGAQEGVEDVFDWIADGLIAWDKNDIKLSIDNYMAQGDSQNMAVLKTVRDKGLELVQDVLGGALSAPFIGGGNVANAYVQGKYSSAPSVQTDIVLNSKKATNMLVEAAKTLDTESLPLETEEDLDYAIKVEHAKEVANKPKNQLTNEDIVDMANALNEQANEENKYAETINKVNYQANKTTDFMQYKQRGAIQQKVDESPIERVARLEAEKLKAQDQKVKRQYDNAIAEFEKKGLESKIGKQLVDFSDHFENETAAKNFLENYHGQNPAWYAEASLQAYHAGESGQNFETFMQNSLQAQMAMTEGGVTEDYLKTLYYNGLNTRPEIESNYVVGENANKGLATNLTEDDKLSDFKKAVARVLGIEVFTDRTEEVIGGKERGTFSANAARMVINANTDNEYAAIIHEMMEYARVYNPQGMENVEKAFVNMLVQKLGEKKFLDAVLEYRNAYRDAGEKAKAKNPNSDLAHEANKTLAEGQEELINDAAAYIWSTEVGMKTLVDWIMNDESTTSDEKLSTLQTLKEWVDKLISAIKDFLSGASKKNLGYTVAKDANFNLEELESISRMLVSALDTARENFKAIEAGKTTEKAENSEKVAHAISVVAEDVLKTEAETNIKTIAKAKPVTNVKGNVEYEKAEDFKAEILALFKKYNYVVKHDIIGDVEIGKKGVGNDLGHHGGEIKRATFYAIPNVIEKGKIIDFTKNYNGKGKDRIVIAAPVTVDGKDTYLVGVVVERISSFGYQKYYMHSVAAVNKNGLPLSEVSEDGLDLTGKPLNVVQILNRAVALSFSNDIVTDSDGKSNPQDIVALNAEYEKAVKEGDEEKAKEYIKKAAELAFPNSKARNEDGSIKEFYHGTNSDVFNEFDTGMVGAANDVGYFGRGFYFAFYEGEARMYGRNVIPAYLNTVNPYYVEDLYKWDGKEVKDYEGNLNNALFALNYSENFPELAKDIKFFIYDEDGEPINYSLSQFKKDLSDVLKNTKFVYENKTDDTYGDIITVKADKVSENGYEWYEYEKDYTGKTVDEVLVAYDYLVETKYNSIHVSQPKNIIMDSNFSDAVKAKGYDSIYQGRNGDEVVLFDSSQIKRSDITYDDNGNLIPLTERFNTDKKDIRYSLTVDSEGKKLSKGQQEYFKDSKVVDEDGNLLRVYHGSMADFTIFDLGEARDSEDIQAFFFSGDKEEAGGYGNRRDFYLNITNPADYDTAYDIFFKERKENPSEAGKRTREKLIELGYDGVIANDGDSPQYTEYLAFYPEQIKLASNTKPTKNEDIRFSLAVDSEGRELTAGQKKYFKDSKIVDKNGNLKVMYHGTQTAGFTVFSRADDKISYFFTDNKKVASTYSRVDYFENPDKPMSFKELSDAAESVTDGSFREENGKIIFEDYDGSTKTFKSIKDAQNWLIDEHIAPMTAQGMGSPSNYEVYLNAKNPLVVDANGSEWNDLPAQSWNKHYGDVDITYSDGTYEVEYMDGETFEWHHDVFDSKKALENKFGKIPELNGFSTAFLSDIYLDKKNQRVPTNTREYAEYAKNNGYDSVIFNDIVDNGIYTDNNIESQVVVVFNPNQIKSIHNENPTENEDIRYSLAVDSDGNELTAGQQSFFKNSKMRDAEGRLKVMYHGTERGGFTVFDAGFSDDGLSLFFTDDADIASAYSGSKEEYKPLRTVKDMKELIHDSYTDIVKDGDTYKVVYDGKVEFEGNFEALKEYVEEQYGVTKGLNYKVYLNTENPLIVDCEGRNWDELPEIAEGVQTTRDYAAYAYENGYDSVIFNDIYDSGVHASGKTKYKNTQVVVVFDSNQVKSVYNENPTEDSDIRHSIDVDAFMDAFEAVDNDVKLNENELHELIKNRMDLESDVSKKMISEVASNIKKLYNSGIDKKTLERDLTTVFRYLKNTARYSMEDVMTVMTDIAKPILENVKVASPEQEKLYKDFTDFVKGYTIALNNEQMQEVRNEFGSYTNFKRMMAGKMKLDKNGTMLDDVWTEISDRSNGKLSFGTNPNDQPVELARYIMSLNPTYQNLQGQSLDAAATDLALEIFRQFYVQQSMTDAAVKVKDEMSRRSQAMKERYQGVYNAAVKQVEYEKALNMKRLAEEIDNLTAEEQEAIRNGDTVNQALIQNIKNEYQKRYDRLQAESVEKIAKAKANYQNAYINKNLRRERSELKNRLLREVKALQNIIAHPQEGATKHVPINLIKPTIEMLEAINLDNGGSNKTIVERLKKMSEVYESFKNNEAYSFDYDERIAHNIEELQQMFENKSYADLSITELERVIEIVTALKTQIKNANNLILQGKLKDAKEAADSAITDVQHSRRNDNAAMNLLNRYGNMHLNAYREFRKLEGYVNGSLMDIYRDLDEGSKREMQIQKDLGEIFADVLEGKENQKEIKKFISTKKEDLVDLGITDKEGKPILVTRAMRMSLIMHSMNAGNMRHILGSGITVPNMYYFEKGKLDEAYAKGTNYRFVDYNELLNAIQKNDTNKINELTTAAQKRIEEMKKDLSPWEQRFLADAEEMFHEETGKIINDVSMKLKGYALARVKNYFPIRTDSHFTQKEWSGLVKDGSLEGSGFLKERVISTKPILLEDITNVVQRQIGSVSKYGGFAIPVRNFETIMKQTKRLDNGELQNLYQVIDNTWGASDSNWLRNMMQDIQGGRGEKGSPLMRLRGQFAGATLSLNPSVAIKQAASYPTAAAVLGWKPLGRALTDVGKGFGGKGIEELEKINPLLWYRSQGYGTQELADAKAVGFGKNLPPKLQKAINWTQWFDTGTVRTLEYASMYYVDENFKNLEKGSTEYWQKVSDTFTKVVEETQPNYSTLHKADIIRNPNSFVKMLVMFKTQPMQNFGIIYDAMGELNAAKISGNKKWINEASEKAAHAISSQVVSASVFSAMTILSQLLLHRWWKYRDDEGEWDWKKLLVAFGEGVISCMTGAFIGGSELYEALKHIFTGESYYGIEISVAEMVNDFVENMGNLTKNTKALVEANTTEDKEKATQKLVKAGINLGATVGEFEGTPVNNIKNMLSAMYFYTMDAVRSIDEGELSISDDSKIENWEIPTQYERIYEAMQSGDEKKYQKLVDELVKDARAGDESLSKEDAAAKVEEKVTQKILNMMKEGYLEGEISSEEMQNFLVEEKGKTEDEAYFQMRQWETGESTYGVLKDSINKAAEEPTPENRKAMIDEVNNLLAHGKDKGTIASQITSNYKAEYIELYNQGKVADLNAMLRAALVAAGYTDEEAKKKLAGWVK